MAPVNKVSISFHRRRFPFLSIPHSLQSLHQATLQDSLPLLFASHQYKYLETHLRHLFNQMQKYPHPSENHRRKTAFSFQTPPVFIVNKIPAQNNVAMSIAQPGPEKGAICCESLIRPSRANECLLCISLNKAMIHPADAHEIGSRSENDKEKHLKIQMQGDYSSASHPCSSHPQPGGSKLLVQRSAGNSSM